MVRCRLDDRQHDSTLRYVAATEFDLWRHLMESKYDRAVRVEEMSVWVPETPEVWDDAMDTSCLEPVMRIAFDKPGPRGTSVPVVRFFPTETYPEAKRALLAHFDPRCRWTVEATPGYFISAAPTGDGGDAEVLEMPSPPEDGLQLAS